MQSDITQRWKTDVYAIPSAENWVHEAHQELPGVVRSPQAITAHMTSLPNSLLPLNGVLHASVKNSADMPPDGNGAAGVTRRAQCAIRLSDACIGRILERPFTTIQEGVVSS